MNVDEADSALLEEKIAEAAVGALQNVALETGLEGKKKANTEL